jgi:hypothetical protein
MPDTELLIREVEGLPLVVVYGKINQLRIKRLYWLNTLCPTLFPAVLPVTVPPVAV